MDALRKYKEQYKFKLFAYCLLPGHFHLLLEPPPQSEHPHKTEALSGIMHDLNTSYTKYFNGKYGRKGHLFRERYKATLVEKEPYLLKLSAYIHLNPQKLNLTSVPSQYPYSSYALYINKELPVDDLFKEETGEILDLLKGRGYEDFTGGLAKEQDFSRLHEYLQKGILGTRDFQDKVRNALSVHKMACQREGAGSGLRLSQKLGIISFIAVFAGLGITYVMKISLTKQENPGAVFNMSYEIPAQIKELLRDLENVEWQIRIISLSDGKVFNDIVWFKEGKFISRNYSQRNYDPSDYSLLIEDENKIIWETTQAVSGETVSWSGEIKRREMEGRLRLRSSTGEARDFSFVSVNSKMRKEKPYPAENP